ncbi:molybdopterin-dependent oxidoreductase [Actinomadura rupiterrae]|uniref:molybdopterin-dependent oxidoreductase n=1 Tax=Actinomadura rupiterrae TaxID=559627 RepID=UPI0020A5616D|nr:molybdopterin-dependent oxidoreductase [Actinomadura rupiterrae]MCP2337648.1 DMSO/TMAO reductase YedYZ molybdopterin-dependent catalytic subunit [Actinomadura rupiterrae]
MSGGRLRDQVVRFPKSLEGRFRSRLHDERIAAWLGIALGVSFSTAFITGLISHFMQHPPDWLHWPSRPINFYRVTQGLHVIGGLATIPLLLAKLWTVYPKLFQWPPFRSLAHAVERGLVFVLVGGSLFQLVTGLLNISYWYAFPFFFTVAHYWTAYLVFGALIIHIANEWAKARHTVMRKPNDDLDRRSFLLSVFAASGTVALFTVGEAFSPLGRLALLAPRRPGVGPQRLPVNRTALAAGVTVSARDPRWRLSVTGRVQRELSLSLAELRAMPQHTVRLPITCVEGWSVSGTWTGVRLSDVLARAGASAEARIRVVSLQGGGAYRTSEVDTAHWRDPDTLLALSLNGEPLALDHGFPCRLIAPNRPGVLQTKWITSLVAE